MKKSQEEIVVGLDALREFARQFPNDIYGQIIIEELLKSMLRIKEKDEKNEETKK
jgi:hypothetical protein